MSAALVNRSLSTLKTELEFLRDSNVITENYYNQVLSSLPDRYQQGSSPIDFPSNGVSTPATNNINQNEKQDSLNLPTPAQNSNEEYAEVIYSYQPQEADDLALRVGDKVKVLEHTSPDWWRGAIDSRTGMFPANYVKKIYNSRVPSPAPSYQQQVQAPNHAPQQYLQHQQYQGNHSPYPPPAVVQYQPPQQQQEQPVVVQQPQKHSHVHKFGSKLGNAAIFGAGATIGSEIVHSIF